MKYRHAPPTYLREKAMFEHGVKNLAGVDEAGRGPLAGPVVAAAVILPPGIGEEALSGIRDSKQLDEARRELYYHKIVRHAVAYAAAEVSAREIEQLNIRRASLLAMARAVERLRVRPDYALVDGRDYPEIGIPGEGIVRGDQTSVTIGAASIVAKVVRDRRMMSLHEKYPEYGFNLHKGYPTNYHRAALRIFGPCAEHRCTYQGVPSPEEISRPGPEWFKLLRSARVCQKLDSIEGLISRIVERADEWERHEALYLEQTARHRRDLLLQRERLLHPPTTAVGRKFEHLAERYLLERGYRVWDRNYRCREGEIDLVANVGGTVAFVEVKARRSVRFGAPQEAVDRRKMRKIIRAAETYLYERGGLGGWDLRYDVMSILAEKGREPVIEHIEDAFRTDDAE